MTDSVEGKFIFTVGYVTATDSPITVLMLRVTLSFGNSPVATIRC